MSTIFWFLKAKHQQLWIEAGDFVTCGLYGAL